MVYRNMGINSLAEYFLGIEDSRDERGKRHRLIDILVLAVIGFLSGFTDFTNMCAEFRYKEDYYTELLGLPNGIPSHDTFSAVFSLIDPIKFLTQFIKWINYYVNPAGQQICIDGKAVRAACDKVHKGKVPYIVNAFMSDLGISVGQLKIEEKTNEIKGIPELLDLLQIEGATITIDAIGCQHDVIEKIIWKGGHFVLAVKDNQKTLAEDIELRFAPLLEEKAAKTAWAKEQSKLYGYKVKPEEIPDFDEFITAERDHGRIEKRHYAVFNNTDCIDKELWPHIKSIGWVERERLIVHKDKYGNILEEEPTVETVAYAMSREMTAEEFACFVRSHWRVENSLHWVLDDYFREDRCTARKDNATENMAMLRKIVLNLMTLDPNVKKMSKRAKGIYYQTHPEEALNLLFNITPDAQPNLQA